MDVVMGVFCYSTSRNWCHHIHSSIVSGILTPRLVLSSFGHYMTIVNVIHDAIGIVELPRLRMTP